MTLTPHIRYKLQATIFALLVFCSTTNSQLSTSKLEEKFNRYGERVLQEKLYMHVDRNYYLAGDIIWYKLYVVDASLHQPLDISKVAYVEVIDENNTAVMQSKIFLQNGKGNGSFSIPISIQSANYKIRAYTNWMKNSGPDYFFEKQITIVNTHKNRDLLVPPIQTKFTPDIRFFPEGGNLVYGINSKIACKVVGAGGKGLSFDGVIIDENNDSIARFQSLQFGMGSFSFTPLLNHTYKAIVTVGEHTFTNALPQIYAQGYIMQLHTADKTHLTVTVQTNITDPGNLFLLVHTRQSLKTVLQS